MVEKPLLEGMRDWVADAALLDLHASHFTDECTGMQPLWSLWLRGAKKNAIQMLCWPQRSPTHLYTPLFTERYTCMSGRASYLSVKSTSLEKELEGRTAEQKLKHTSCSSAARTHPFSNIQACVWLVEDSGMRKCSKIQDSKEMQLVGG